MPQKHSSRFHRQGLRSVHDGARRGIGGWRGKWCQRFPAIDPQKLPREHGCRRMSHRLRAWRDFNCQRQLGIRLGQGFGATDIECIAHLGRFAEGIKRHRNIERNPIKEREIGRNVFAPYRQSNMPQVQLRRLGILRQRQRQGGLQPAAAKSLPGPRGVGSTLENGLVDRIDSLKRDSYVSIRSLANPASQAPRFPLRHALPANSFQNVGYFPGNTGKAYFDGGLAEIEQLLVAEKESVRETRCADKR